MSGGESKTPSWESIEEETRDLRGRGWRDLPPLDQFIDIQIKEREAVKPTINKDPPKPIYQNGLFDEWSLRGGSKRKSDYPPNGTAFERGGQDDKNGFLIVMRRNKMRSGKPYIEFDRNGFGMHSKWARNFEEKKHQYQAIRLEKFDNFFFSLKGTGPIHPFYQICMNQAHHDVMEKKDLSAVVGEAVQTIEHRLGGETKSFSSKKVLDFVNFKAASKLGRDNNSLAKEIWDRRKEAAPRNALQNLFHQKITALDRTNNQYARPFVEYSNRNVYHDHEYESPSYPTELLVTPGIAVETQRCALAYAQIVFNEAKNTLQTHHSSNETDRVLQNIQIPLTLIHSHRHILYGTKEKPPKFKQKEPPNRKGPDQRQIRGTNRWRIHETYIFIASKVEHDAVVAAVTRPRLRKTFSEIGGYAGLPAMEFYMYLPYYAHKLWNNYERLRILKNATIRRRDVASLVEKKFETLKNILEKHSWHLLRYVVYAKNLRRDFAKDDSRYTPENNFLRVDWQKSGLDVGKVKIPIAAMEQFASSYIGKKLPERYTEELIQALTLASLAATEEISSSKNTKLHPVAERLGLRF